ncbi:alpha-ketoacid dehydrogenase subunit alpha/beta [Cyclobacterium marinum]|uniref:Transketolase domain-containing protein n=1 Tax=Cyclobacterium marinum (strain ATCC 25205 / DSM 745 / LMG 13164 / NCIMB 1802) TaxID=880070 RepID=G0IW72_CYCMS|nr:alpha-ketoacid dehydrogenase subunit alpha/beta [Cyclobacterium marinum]AEL26292.1 Transketolase domain-containing protein [Cyclobacterium marinum DSM 745]
MNTEYLPTLTKENASILDVQSVLNDYRMVMISRHASLTVRKEVFMGKAKFGVYGDGKELAQVAMAKFFRMGDFRSGYYRDQTLLFAMEELSIQEYFAQLYAHTDINAEPASGGRLMNAHFATRSLNEDGSWKNLMKMKNSTADISPTAAQMPKLLGLAYASKLYRENTALHDMTTFSNKGNEVAWGTIGNASTAEGMFFETFNAGGVLQVPMVISVWDDEYGISVTNDLQITKSSISAVLEGFKRDNQEKGYEILVVNGWDYKGLVNAYGRANKLAREKHIPVLVHVQGMTQPQGHSTSGSHERYKSKERLAWEAEHDCVVKFKEYILENKIASEEELDQIDSEAKKLVKESKDKAWKAFTATIRTELEEAVVLLNDLAKKIKNSSELIRMAGELKRTLNPVRMDVISTVRKALLLVRNEPLEVKLRLQSWYRTQQELNEDRYSSHQYSESAFRVEAIAPVEVSYPEKPELLDGREVLKACFDAILSRDPRVFVIGEDVGQIGDVNQAFAGLQAKHGSLRVTDTGIREVTIIGQGIGAALRGLRPITEVQYLDYLIYALMTLSDDLACLHYRTKGGQKAPLIIRTRGHRLEGVWHSGSPISMILGSLRGILLCVPRNMTQAAGMYNTLLEADQPAIVIESLNGYRLKEKMPSNIGTFKVALGKAEVLQEGKDITVVTYGSMCRIVMDAAKQLFNIGIYVEVIDVQTLVPFDLDEVILNSIKKTNRVIFADEDVPGGASAYMMQQVLEKQNAYYYLDAQPITLSAKEHRPAYSSDGDYFSKPSVDDVVEKVYSVMNEADPKKFPEIY